MLDELQKYGLTMVQAKVYCCLVKMKKTSSTKVAKEIGVHRSEVYRVLRELVKIGIASENIATRPIQYAATPPDRALQHLVQIREKEIEHLKTTLPELLDWLNKQSKPEHNAASILIVDDDDTIAKGLSRVLEREGFRVDCARDGQQAIKRFDRRKYILAVVDIRLPDMDGTELLKKLRTRDPKIKQIVITGHPSVQNAIKAIDDGAVGYIMKPFEPEILLAKIREKIG